MKLTIFLFIVAVVSYALGGLNGAIITSVNLHRRDVRKYGSRNAGLTNFARVFGVQGTVWVILVDVLKTVISILFGRWLIGTQGYPVVGALFSGFCTMLGHVYPAYYGFRGGKAVLCGGVIAWMVDWRVGLICWTVFLIIVVFTKYVSLGSICSALTMPAGIWAFGHPGLDIILSLICALLLIFAHRENLVRLIKGTEAKFNIGGASGRA